MKIAASIELIWQMATQEAIAREFAEIAPEHFLAAILKFSELPADQLGNVRAEPELPRELVADIGRIRDGLARRGIDSTRVRRELRRQIGKGGSPHARGQRHRSQASRELFDAAARLADAAGSEVLAPEHLLEAIWQCPTPIIRKVLGDELRAQVDKRSNEPEADEDRGAEEPSPPCGRDRAGTPRLDELTERLRRLRTELVANVFGQD